MRKKFRSGKVMGPFALLVVTFALGLVLAGGALSLALTRNKCREVGMAIRNLESERTSLERDKRSYEEIRLRATDVLSLKEGVKDRLQPPAPGQVVVVRQRPSIRPAAERSVPDDPRFTALDIAFINAAPARGMALR